MLFKISWRRFFSRLFSFISIFVAASALFLWWAVGRDLPKSSKLTIFKSSYASTLQPKAESSFTIATYNIAHGQGIKDEPTDWREKDYTEKQLSMLENVVQKLNADILFLQEVDFNSNRSHYINEAKKLIEAGKYPYYACAEFWHENHVPFPYWPPEHQIGYVESGNCILSKYPLSNHRRHLFIKPLNNPFWYNWGYLDRGTQIVDVRIGDKVVTLFNLHLEAWHDETRHKQIEELSQLVKEISNPIIIGGDFNAILPEATQKNHFRDEPDADFSNDHVHELLRQKLPSYTSAISKEQYLQNETAFLSFPANAPTRLLDHVFALQGIYLSQGRVVKEAGVASDHLPVIAAASFTNAPAPTTTQAKSQANKATKSPPRK